MDIIIVPLILLLKALLNLAYWFVICYVLINLMCTFRVINLSNRFIASIINCIYRIVEPPLYFINKFIPNVGIFDISPIILILAIIFFDNILSRLLLRF